MVFRGFCLLFIQTTKQGLPGSGLPGVGYTKTKMLVQAASKSGMGPRNDTHQEAKEDSLSLSLSLCLSLSLSLSPSLPIWILSPSKTIMIPSADCSTGILATPKQMNNDFKVKLSHELKTNLEPSPRLPKKQNKTKRTFTCQRPQ